MIRYYEGIEGSGKSTMLTRDLYYHALYGGRILTFPGYELFGENRKHVLSEVIFPEQLYELLASDDVKDIRQQKIAVAMDEVLNFFNHHNWQNKIVDILYMVMAQRRKLAMSINMTGPEFENLPADIRGMVHEIIHVTDMHQVIRVIPRGVKSIYYKEDRRGMFSSPQARYSKRRVFPLADWFRHFDTYAAVGYNANVKVRIANREVLYDSEGNRIEKNNRGVDPANYDGILKQYQPAEDKRYSQVREVLNYLKKKGQEVASSAMIQEMLGADKLFGRNSYGSILKEYGAIYYPHNKTYKLPGGDISK